MRSTNRGASCGSEHSADRPIVRNRVRSRGEAPEAIPTVVVAEQVGSARHAFVRVLDVIEAVLVGLPHFDPGVRDRPAGHVSHGSLHPAWLPGGPARDVAAVVDTRRILGEERTEDSGFRGVTVGHVVDVDRLHRCAEDVGEQDEFLAAVIGDVPYCGEKLDSGVPFVLGEPYIADECVQMLDECLHHEGQPVVLTAGEGLHDGAGQVFLYVALRVRHRRHTDRGVGYGTGELLAHSSSRFHLYGLAGSATGHWPAHAADNRSRTESYVIGRGLP